MKDKTIPSTRDLQGARRATGESRAINDSTPDPQVVAQPVRRRFTAKYKLKVLEQADQCTTQGEIGELLRREGLYSSHLSNWRRLRKDGSLQSLATKKRGPKANPNAAHAREVALLQKQVKSLQNELDKANTIIDVQKKLSRLLTSTADNNEGSS